MIKQPLSSPSPLTKDHYTDDFNSGSPELDEWLKKFGWINHCSGNARVFVTAKSNRVFGYYALTTAGVEREDAPEKIQKGGVPPQIPCILLARLAVDESEKNRGVGKGLLVDAIRRAINVSEDVGVRAFLIHAKDEDARAFYEHQGEFVQSPTDPLHLFLHLKHARARFGES
jgi:GNAT superfamily N-acetyltransferase